MELVVIVDVRALNKREQASTDQLSLLPGQSTDR